jgi:hypothetical protein
VKEINNEFRSERERERLLREIYALSTQGDNVHVVRYFNAWEQDDKLYIQTELCTGSLDDGANSPKILAFRSEFVYDCHRYRVQQVKAL